MVTKLGRQKPRVSVEVQGYHVEQIIKRGISVPSYAREKGMSSATLYRWMDKFSQLEQMGKKEKRSSKELSSEEFELLRQENALLKVQLADERLRRETFEKMIEIAEKRFNIAIEKKSGAKRSKK